MATKKVEKKDEREVWEQMVERKEATMYIKPTTRKHGSGFRVFEVGYMKLDEDNKMKEKLVLSNGSDHIHTSYEEMVRGQRTWLNMDLTMDGYIRLWGLSTQFLVWEKYPMSSAEINVRERIKEVQGKTSHEPKKA